MTMSYGSVRCSAPWAGSAQPTRLEIGTKGADMDHPTRRAFLGSVGHGMLIASLGSALASELGAC